jgi:2-oxoisovalerate dehydrogenase E2 component (dihydrolipoyl transacylase)
VYVEVKLHDIGEGMTEATINHFFVQVGDAVRADQPLVEVQTDKMTAEIPSPFSGTIKELLVKEGDVISVGTTVLLLEKQEVLTEKSSKNQSNIHRRKRVIAAPHTRKIARENQVEIEQITGTGTAGRILDEDIYRFLASKTSKETNKTNQQYLPQEKLTSEKSTEIPFRGRRKQIASKMAQSLKTIPHCTHFEEIDVTNAIEWKKQVQETGHRVSLSAFFIKAISISLSDFPIFNSKIDEENECIKILEKHHIGIATDTEDGLIVPVIRHVGQKSINQIQSEMKQLTVKAKENKLSYKDVTGGTFTISNVGPLNGSIGATPIINESEAALVAFHKTKRRPVVSANDEIVVRSMMNISMSFDHRVADGGTAVAFTNRLTELIENPNLLLLEMV